MFTLLKALCLLAYVAAAAVLAGLLPDTLYPVVYVAAALLAGHLLELVLMFRFVKRFPGPLATSVMLTLLYGFLHWGPLRKQPAAR